MIPTLIYLLGYAALWRYVVGWLLDDFGLGSKPDGSDVVFAILIGSIATLFWPLIVVGLVVRRIWIKFDDNFDVTKIFPAPKNNR